MGGDGRGAWGVGGGEGGGRRWEGRRKRGDEVAAQIDLREQSEMIDDGFDWLPIASSRRIRR